MRPDPYQPKSGPVLVTITTLGLLLVDKYGMQLSKCYTQDSITTKPFS
jgi:hypothetical protein